MRVFFCVLFVCVYSFGVRFETDKGAVSHGRPDDWSRSGVHACCAYVCRVASAEEAGGFVEQGTCTISD